MAQLLDEIQWSEPLLPPDIDPAWEAELKRRGGNGSEVDRRIAPSPWLREACLGVNTGQASEIPAHLFNLAALVTSQENACRYCYGANRAYMKVLGYSEAYIRRIEHEVHLADLNHKERALVAFCRNLARSRPRPPLAERDALLRDGYSLAAAHEIALWIALGCLYNRVTILIASPPELGFEGFANGPKAWLFLLMGPWHRYQAERRRRGARDPAMSAEVLRSGVYGAVLAPLEGLPAAKVMKAALDGAFASSVLSRAVKALMFGIVARSLGCRASETEARRLAAAEGYSDADFDKALATLECPRLPAPEARLLPWVRDTVHIQTAQAQARTRELAGAMDRAAVLEAVGVASLANATVRLAMLVQ
jgi:alkylhydroperoxidase family enzyme